MARLEFEFARVVRSAEFLFSSPVLEDLCSGTNVQELAAVLTHVFESLSQHGDRDWQPMTIFVLEMAGSRAVYRRIEENVAELEQEIGDLKSVRGQLMERCRMLKEDQRKTCHKHVFGYPTLLFSYRRSESNRQS
jgi:hypothetical protein